MSSDISLSKAVRSNLLSLQNTATMMAKTQDRLATGNKVNSALDNPTNFFTAASLNSRAGDLNQLMDGMANGIQTLEAADNGLTSITKTLESMQSTLRQARQDKSFQTASYTIPTTGLTGTSELSFTGGAVGIAAVPVELTKGTAGVNTFNYAASNVAFGPTDTSTFAIAVDGGTPQTVTINEAIVKTTGNGNSTIDTIDEYTAALNAALTASGVTGVTAANNGTAVTLTSKSLGLTSSVAITAATPNADGAGNTNTLYGMANGAGTAGAADGGAIKTVDELVADINSTANLKGKVRATNDNGKLRIENQSTQILTITGANDAALTGLNTAATEIAGNTIRKDLAGQFNELRDQLDKTSDDASFNGVNLLRGDNLKITFNENGTSSIDIQTKEGETLNASNLGLSNVLPVDLDSDANIDEQLSKLKIALNEVRSQSSAFGSNLSIVQNRQDFTKNMINTLETGGANLTLADMNEEAANLLALQTRQSLSSSSLSLASQADQSVLQLLQ